MSGQQIGTVVGGVIGFYFGGPAGAQLGMAIGGAVGGAIDPTKINGPHIGDGQQQSATDGNPIAWVMGTAMVAGTVVQVGPRREVKVKDSGKGGPEVSHNEARQDFAVLICESCELRDSTMSSVLMVMQDGQIVYDVRPGSKHGWQGTDNVWIAIAAGVVGVKEDKSHKWKRNVDFMFGGEDQLPHPTLEAITGVGNTPAYRGSLVAVFKDFNVTAAGDRIPQFQFVVASKSVGTRYDDPGWKYKVLPAPGVGVDDSAPQGYLDNSFDDSGWESGRGGFGYRQYDADDEGNVWQTNTPVIIPNPDTYGDQIWVRRKFSPFDHDVNIQLIFCGGMRAWWNGVLIASHNGINHATSGSVTVPAAQAGGENILVIKSVYIETYGGLALAGANVAAQSFNLTLADAVQRICVRGGLDADDYEADALYGTELVGYPIARQANAADCLLPLLQAYFAFASEYDARLHFKYYGDDALVTVNRDDLIEGNDSNNGAIVSNLRNQGTEFPRRIVASYMDPEQNYMSVDVSAERRSIDVVAIGDKTFQIPVVMSADDAAKAADKALKVAYATLEGTLEYSVPFADSDVYISMAAGEPLQLQGKRYVMDEMILGNGNLKLTTRYDRQSAYQSNVQAILGNPALPPTSPYSGPTTLIAMNLPSLRPQDLFGVYLAAASTDGRVSWKGCTVQVSYDDQQSWQNSTQIVQSSVFGALTADEPAGGEPITAQMNGDLESITPEQLAANGNAFALLHATSSEVGQFQTATETANEREYELTDVIRGGLGTVQEAGVTGDQLVMLESVYFLPIDPAFAGKTIYFRAVGFGEVAESATIVSLVYAPDTTVIHDGGVVKP